MSMGLCSSLVKGTNAKRHLQKGGGTAYVSRRLSKRKAVAEDAQSATT